MLIHSPVGPKKRPDPEPFYLTTRSYYDFNNPYRAELIRQWEWHRIELMERKLPFVYCRLYKDWTGEFDGFDCKLIYFNPPIGPMALYYCEDTAEPKKEAVADMIKCYRPLPLQGILVKYKPHYTFDSVDYRPHWFTHAP